MTCFASNNREVCKEKLGLEDSDLKYIITKKELENDSWLRDLNLKTNKMREEYHRLISTILGSELVSFQTQVFSYMATTQEITSRISGARGDGEVMGVGGSKWPAKQTLKFTDLKFKPLGDIFNIIFWSQSQMQLLNSLGKQQSTIIYGDFG